MHSSVDREPFDLSKDYMLRASLISIGDQDHVLVLTMHHIASDGWSVSIIIKEIAELYESEYRKREADVASLTGPVCRLFDLAA